MTTKTVMFALVACAGAAHAGLGPVTHDRPIFNIEDLGYTAVPLDDSAEFYRAVGVQYSNMALGGIQGGLDANGGVVGVADYTSIASQPIDLQSFRFVGGVAEAGGILFFDFFNPDTSFADGFGVRLSNPGNFIYTITINDFPGGVVVPQGGFLQVESAAAGVGGNAFATTGVWFVNDLPETVGDAGVLDVDIGDGTDLNFKFELIGEPIPTPGAASMLALAGLAAARRRR